MATAGTTGTGLNSVIETKVVAGSGVAVLSGLLTWALVTFIPSWHDGIPSDLLPFIPFAAAWLLSTGAAYFAPHTHRPDLAVPVTAADPAPSGVPIPAIAFPPGSAIPGAPDQPSAPAPEAPAAPEVPPAS